MSTENRSSNTEMVSVPREAVVQAAELLQEYNKCSIARDLRAILAQPAVQHQGEPVALPERKGTHLRYDTLMPTFSKGWNACLDEIAKLGPLYSRPVQGEPVAWEAIEALAWGAFADGGKDYRGCTRQRLRELREVYTHTAPGEVERLRTMLDQTDGDLRSVTADRDTLRAETDRLRQEVASIDKKLRGNVSDPDPLKPIMPGALSITTTYGLVAGIVRERDQLKKALERQS